MGRTLHKLTDRQVKSLSNAGRYSDGGNLYLVVRSAGSKSWTFFYKFKGKQREMGLGPAGKAGAISLSAARRSAEDARSLLANGQDPLEVRRARERQAASDAKAKLTKPTFGEWAERYVSTHEGSWSNPKHRQQWRSTLLNDAASIGELCVDEINTSHVLEVLKPIWQSKSETARRLRARIERVLDAAIAAGDREHPNPALWKGNLEPLLPRPKSKHLVEHHRALDYAEVPAFVTALRQRQATAALALEFLILTASRTSEVTGATWAEVNLGNGLWTIPAARMKAKKEHIVPLSDRALEIAKTLLPLANGDNFAPIFPSSRGKFLSNMAMLKLLDRMSYRDRTTVHGFRSSFRIWAAEQTSFAREVAEAALAHQNPDRVEAAYQRSTLLPKRRELMDQWAQFCGGSRDAG